MLYGSFQSLKAARIGRSYTFIGRVGANLKMLSVTIPPSNIRNATSRLIWPLRVTWARRFTSGFSLGSMW